jgi:hypothetical protein
MKNNGKVTKHGTNIHILVSYWLNKKRIIVKSKGDAE